MSTILLYKSFRFSWLPFWWYLFTLLNYFIFQYFNYIFSYRKYICLFLVNFIYYLFLITFLYSPILCNCTISTVKRDSIKYSKYVEVIFIVVLEKTLNCLTYILSKPSCLFGPLEILSCYPPPTRSIGP